MSAGSHATQTHRGNSSPRVAYLGEASEISVLNLSDALVLVVLMTQEGHLAADRAAAKWVARLGVEHPLSLQELRVALDAVTLLPHHPDDARRHLADVCARHGLTRVIGLLG